MQFVESNVKWVIVRADLDAHRPDHFSAAAVLALLPGSDQLHLLLPRRFVVPDHLHLGTAQPSVFPLKGLSLFEQRQSEAMAQGMVVEDETVVELGRRTREGGGQHGAAMGMGTRLVSQFAEQLGLCGEEGQCFRIIFLSI